MDQSFLGLSLTALAENLMPSLNVSFLRCCVSPMVKKTTARREYEGMKGAATSRGAKSAPVVKHRKQIILAKRRSFKIRNLKKLERSIRQQSNCASFNSQDHSTVNPWTFRIYLKEDPQKITKMARPQARQRYNSKARQSTLGGSSHKKRRRTKAGPVDEEADDVFEGIEGAGGAEEEEGEEDFVPEPQPESRMEVSRAVVTA
jgi:hypothetical protein